MEAIEAFQSVAITVMLIWLGWASNGITKIRSHAHELREWHKPDDSGRQLWKNPDLAEAVTELIGEIRGLRGDFKDVIPKLQEEHRAQDRDVSALTTQVSEIRTMLNKKD